MAEALGVIASAMQLVEYSLKVVSALSEAFEKVRTASTIFNGKIDQVFRLIQAADTVRQNAQLHTPIIATQLQATITEANSLHSTLLEITFQYTRGSFQKRYWKAITKKGEKSLLEAFERLDREKASLLLCIQISGFDIMSEISKSLKDFTKALEKRNEPSNMNQNDSVNARRFGKVCKSNLILGKINKN